MSCDSAFLRQYSGMQGVPEIEGMQQSEAPLEEIEVKTVIELFGITVRDMNQDEAPILAPRSSFSIFLALCTLIVMITCVNRLANPGFYLLR